MKILTASFFLFLLVSYRRTQSNNKQAEEKSDLELIIDDLYILTRVVNAIALSKEIFQKGTSIRVIIGDLLLINEEMFESVMSHDPSELISRLDEIERRYSNVYKRIQEYDDKLEYLERHNNELKEDLKLELNQTDIEKIFKYLNNMPEPDSLLACDTNAVNMGIDFWKVISDSVITETEHWQRNTILKMHTNISQVLNCLESLKNYSITSKSTFDVLTQLRKVKKARDFHKSVFDSSAIHPNVNYFNFSKFSHYLKALPDVFKKSKTNRTTYESNIHKIISDTNTVLQNLLKQNRKEGQFSLQFGTVDNISTVSQDLNSAWFQQKVSMGKSVDGLQKELEKISKFYDLFVSFGNAIVYLYENFGINTNSFLAMRTSFEIFNRLENIELAAPFLNKMEDIYENCKGIKADNDHVFEEFDSNTEQIKVLRRRAFDISQWINHIFQSVDFELLKDSLNAFKSIPIYKMTMKESINSIKNIENYATLNMFLSLFSNLADFQNEFLVSFNGLNETKLVDVLNKTVEHLNNSTLFKAVKCLNNNTFDSEQLEKIISYLRSFKAVSNPTDYKNLKSMLTSYENVKEALLKIDNYTKESKTERKINSPPEFIRSLQTAKELGNGMVDLQNLLLVFKARKTLSNSTHYSPEVVDALIKDEDNKDIMNEFWKPQSQGAIEQLVNEMEELNCLAGRLKDQSLQNISTIFLNASTTRGLGSFSNVFRYIAMKLELNSGTMNSNFTFAKKNAQELRELKLDFSDNTNLQVAVSAVIEAQNYFKIVSVDKKEFVDYRLVIILSSVLFIVFVVSVAIYHGFTEKGKNCYRNLYLYYFGKPADFEKRWRYSYFLDTQDSKNALIDAVREINKANVLEIVRKGAYINVYSAHGNTPLHSATKLGYPEIVEILIKNGADRNLLNYQNKTPEQMLLARKKTTALDQAVQFEKIAKIYKKHMKKKFRVRVPAIFPVSSFSIYPESRTDDVVTNKFMDAFPAICTTELTNSTTHHIMKTGPDGIAEADNLEVLQCILTGLIIVKDTWMTDCLKNRKLIEKDYDYLVEKVKYNEVVYDTVVQWTEALAKSTMPYLYGVFVAVVIENYPNLRVLALATIVSTHGGRMCDKFPEKSDFNIGSHPYLHADLGPLFIIHDGKINLDVYKNDKDKMYTLFTEEEFLHFMLKKKTKVDESENPVPVLIETGD